MAFVKSKVAVYVYEDAPADRKPLEDDGWMILKFEAGSITDGEKEATEIRRAVRENTKNLKKRRK